jgi:hypothetical protein
MDTTEPGKSAPDQPSPMFPPVRKKDITGGIVLIVLGLLFLANNLLPRFDFFDYWPLILIAIGASLLWKTRQS